MSFREELSTITIAANHDLSFTITYEDGSGYRWLVSASAVCLASPVWAAMLKPTSSFRETETKEIELKEDDEPEAILILLRIAHLQHLQIPVTLSFEQLYEMAVVCDKYDTVTLVTPWLGGWATEEMRGFANEPDYERWLFIAYTFGFDDVFERAAKSLVSSSKTDRDGQCLNSDEMYLEGSYPPDIIGKVPLSLLPTLPPVLKTK